MNNENHNVREIAALVAAGLAPVSVAQDLSYAIVPEGYELHSLEYLMAHPSRKRNAMQFDDVESLLAYLSIHATPETLVYMDETEQSFVAVINEASSTTPAFRDHRATLRLVQSELFTAIKNLCGKFQPQVAFAEWIQMNSHAFHKPDAARMLTIANEFEATGATRAKFTRNPDNGNVSIAYEGQTTPSIDIPRTILVIASVFRYSEPRLIELFLRYRSGENGVQFSLHPVRPWADVIREEMMAEKVRIENAELRVLIGKG